MNNTSTEHVTKKNIELALNFTKSIDFNILLVILLACAGLSTVWLSPESFICHNQSNNMEVWKPLQISNHYGYAVRIMDESSIYSYPEKEATFLASTTKPSLEVAGIREIHEPLTFAMSDFNKKMTYSIDFGNGITKSLAKESIPHVYNEPGNYRVTVTAMHEGEAKVLSTKFLMVADAMETPAFIAESKI